MRLLLNPLSGDLDYVNDPTGIDTVTFRQSILASTWTVPHALGRRPQVEVTDDAGTDLMPTIVVDSSAPYTVEVVHSTPLTGWVYLT